VGKHNREVVLVYVVVSMRRALVILLIAFFFWASMRLDCQGYSCSVVIFGLDPKGCSVHNNYFIVANRTSTSIEILNISMNGTIIDTNSLPSTILRLGSCVDLSYGDECCYLLMRGNKYSIAVLDRTYRLVEVLTINLSYVNMEIDSLEFDGENFWVSYHRTDRPQIGVVKMNEWLNKTEQNISIGYPKDVSKVYAAHFFLQDENIWIIDNSYAIYHADMTGNVELIKNVSGDIDRIAEGLNATDHRLIDMASNSTHMWICVLYVIGNERAMALVSYRIPGITTQTTTQTTTPTTGAKMLIFPYSQLLVGFLCAIALFLLMMLSNRSLTVIQPKYLVKEEAMLSKEETTVKAKMEREMGEKEAGVAHVEEEHPTPIEIPGAEKMERLRPTVYKKVGKEGIIARLRYLLGLRKIRHIPEKDKPEKPNFNKAMGYAALFGLTIGIALYIVSIIRDIFVSIGINVGLLLSVAGIVGSTILILLRVRGEIHYGKITSLMLAISYIIAAVGIYINAYMLIRVSIYILLLDMALAILLVVHRYIRYRIVRSMILRYQHQ